MSDYKFQQIAPTPARGKFIESLYTDKGWWAEEKFDGDRRIAQFCLTSDQSGPGEIIVRFTGRRISDKDGLFVEKTGNVPHLNGDHHTVPESLLGTVLDGEIICTTPGARSKDVTSIMGSLPEEAVRKQEARGWVQYVVFDCLFYKGIDMRNKPLSERRNFLEAALREWGNPHAVPAKIVTENRADFVAEVLARGGEGIILKETNSTYTQEKRWVKVKKEFTEDVVIMGYDDPEKESTKTSGETSITKFYKLGWIGAVRFGQYKDGVLTFCGSCSGMDDSLRKELSENKEKHLGRVVEILANEREPTGRFRHPRWIQFRDNKNAKDCKWGEK